MKLKNINILLIVILLMVLLTGCDFETLNKQLECNHDYEVIQTNATCTTPGTSIYKCKKCDRQMEVRVESSGHNYEIVSKVDPSCTETGEKTLKCKNCSDEITLTVPVLPHVYADWVKTKEATADSDGEETRTCIYCGHEDKKAIKFLEGMDMTYLELKMDKETYDINSIDDFKLYFFGAILNMKKSLKLNIKMDFDEFNDKYENVSQLNEVPFDYKVKYEIKTSLTSKEISMTFEYDCIPSQATLKEKKYVQLDSLNYNPITKTRSDDFDDFKINKSLTSYNVSETEQLVYVLQRRALPICESGSNAEKVYKEIKKVLREIISDDMNDYEKVKAIHDWLVMNVVYDQELADLFNVETNLKKYNGFYLEGVFLDHNAVCEGIAKSFAVMANMEGIPCVVVTGNSVANPNGAGHAWNKIYVDGNWYVIDATSDGTIVGDNEVLSYEYFMISEATMKEKYKSNDYVNFSCVTTYNVLENTTFNFNDNTYTFSIKSKEDFANVLKYFNSTSKSDVTIQVKIDFELGMSINNLISKASLEAGISKQYRYISGDKFIMLID